jgi:Ca-activated chloride channel family protein
MMGFRFHDPFWLLLLVPLAALGWWNSRRRAAAVVYSSVELLKSLPTTTAQRVRRLLPLIGLTGLALLVVALARPQQGKEEYRVRADGIAIEMCIDRSGSMNAKDFEISGEPASRLEVVRRTFRQFVDGGDGLRGRPDDLIGLIDFGGYVEVKCPLTLDHGALEQLLDTVRIAEPVVDAEGRVVNPKLLQEDQSTAIGDALATAVDRLKAIKAKSKIIILLSDGVSNAGILTPEEAAQIAKTFGIKVYTIGIGSTKQVDVPMANPFGQTVMMPMQVEFDERALRHIADMTDGQYFNAEDTKSLRDVYAAINQLEKTVSEGRIYTDYRDLYEYALLPGLALLLLQVVLASTRFRMLP